MKRLLLPTLCLLLLSFSGCKHPDDFEFRGTVIGYEFCTTMQDLAYLVTLEYPENLGGSYTTQDGRKFDNVVVIYQADQLLRDLDYIGGRIYLDEDYAKSYCSRTYTDRDVPEAVFTKLDILKQ